MENNWTPFSMLHCPRVSHGLTESRMSEQFILSGRETYSDDKDIPVDLCAGTPMFDSPFSWILGNFDDVLEWVFEYREYERLDRWFGWETAVEGWFGNETAGDRWFGRVTAVGAWFGRDTGIGRCLGRDICGQMSVDDVGRPILALLFGAASPVGHFIVEAVFDMLQKVKILFHNLRKHTYSLIHAQNLTSNEVRACKSDNTTPTVLCGNVYMSTLLARWWFRQTLLVKMRPLIMYNLHNLQWDIATKIQTIIIIVRRLKSPAIRFSIPKMVHRC